METCEIEVWDGGEYVKCSQPAHGSLPTFPYLPACPDHLYPGKRFK